MRDGGVRGVLAGSLPKCVNVDESTATASWAILEILGLHRYGVTCTSLAPPVTHVIGTVAVKPIVVQLLVFHGCMCRPSGFQRLLARIAYCTRIFCSVFRSNMESHRA